MDEQDSISDYRLNMDDLERYLQTLFPGNQTIQVLVSLPDLLIFLPYIASGVAERYKASRRTVLLGASKKAKPCM